MHPTLPDRFSASLAKNQEMIRQFMKPETNNDLITRPFSSMGRDGCLYYIDGMAQGDEVAQHILRPLMRAQPPEPGIGSPARYAMERWITAPEVKTEPEPRAALTEMLRGQCLVLLDSCAEALVIDMRGYVHRSVEKPVSERVVTGPHEAFNEMLRDNLTLLHRKLPTEKLMCTMQAVGTEVSCQCAVCWLEDACPPATVRRLQQRLSGAAVDAVTSIGMLEQLLEDDPHAPLPQTVLTERPDRAVSFLLEGQAVVLMDGSPRALVMPVSLWHLSHAPDDSSMRWPYGTAMRLLRLCGALAALLAPALFVCIYTFHPSLLPMTLLTSILQSRTVLPVSLYGEAFLLLVIFDLINESGTRAPELMGSSLGLVSTLILGTAAVEARLVSPLLLITVALSGLGSFALPDYSLAFAFRMAQLLLVPVAGLTGFGGLLATLLLLCFRVAGMESLGAPYLAPAAPLRPRNPDLILRPPVYRQRLRGYLSRGFHVRRAVGRMRRW
ncbi:MAG: spore germination protein [Clostridia bacterium]|nr:spore germination protein [Clostridia bacterium]